MRQSKERTADSKEEVKRLKGDGLYLKMNSNHGILEITGDGSMISLAKNSGSVRVVGDGCHLKVTHNVGDIVYKGDGGCVSLGTESSKERVTYIGDGGQITFDTSPKKTPLKTSSSKTDIFRKAPSKETIKCNEDTKITIIKDNTCNNTLDIAKRINAFHHSLLKDVNENNGEKAKNHGSGRRRNCDAISPEMENLRNERKEATERSGKEEEHNENAVIVTKFVTTQRNGQSVKKWFVRQASVIKPMDVPVQIVTLKPRTTTEGC